jgi:hypothetical protein
LGTDRHRTSRQDDDWKASLLGLMRTQGWQTLGRRPRSELGTRVPDNGRIHLQRPSAVVESDLGPQFEWTIAIFSPTSTQSFQWTDLELFESFIFFRIVQWVFNEALIRTCSRWFKYLTLFCFLYSGMGCDEAV